MHVLLQALLLECAYVIMVMSLGLLLGTEAPIMAPNGVDFSFPSFVVVVSAQLCLCMHLSNVCCAVHAGCYVPSL